MSAESYLDPMAEFVTTASWSALPDKAREAGRRVFLDVLGANLRGSEEPENAGLGERYESRAGRGFSTFLRVPFNRGDALSAAFVNGTQAPSVELDDGFRFATAHSGAYVMSGTLALAEELDASLEEALTAFIVGYEIASRGALAARGPKFKIMQHGIFSALGTAAAASVLRRHDMRLAKETLRIASSFAHITNYSVLREGATVRNLWTGAGARDGLVAAEAAELGFTGLNDAIRANLSMAMPEFDQDALLARLGDEFCVTTNYHKQYACNGNFDASLQAILELTNGTGIPAKEINRIVVEIYAPYHTLDASRPRNPLAAKFSLRYAVAAAAVCGHADHEAFTADRLQDPEILSLVDRTELREDASLAAELPRIRPARVTVTARDGSIHTNLVKNPRGHFDNPFSAEELRSKFSRLAGRYLTREGVDGVIQALEGTTTSARHLTDGMRDHVVESRQR